MSCFIDTHLHLDFLEELQSEIAAAQAVGVERYVVPGTSIERWPQLMAAVAAVPGAFAAPGVHPLHADRWDAGRATELQRFLEDPRAIAIGEIGLDRQVAVSAATQEAVFCQMIRLARELEKPLLIHHRGATARLIELLQQEQAERVGGIFHAFSGSLETAQRAIALGFAIGIGGVVTYPEARRLPEVVRQLPAEWLVLETDAPDLAPHPHRGQDNRPAYLPLIAAKVAELRGWDLAETARVTSANACRVLRLPAADDFTVTGL